MDANSVSSTNHFTTCSSSSSSSGTLNHDVFLSFKDEDPCKTFTDHLLTALERNNLCTFQGDAKLRRGESISDDDEMAKAIANSKAAIVVFSKRYATCRRCLDEVVKTMECRRRKQQIVLPVFYDVKPTDVRAQKGCYAEAFMEHERGGRLHGQVQAWRDALTEAANLSGFDLTDLANGHESKFIDRIVEDVSDKLNPTHLSVADCPVGLERRIQQLHDFLYLQPKDVQFLAICGIGGIGKTTIAKEIYNRLHLQFERYVFLANVRETSKQPNGLVLLQTKLLSGIIKHDDHKIENVHHGTKVLERKLRCQRVLIVLDDVDSAKQIKALAISRNGFCAGSKIVITTRDMSALNSLWINEDNEMYDVPELDAEESLQLFNWHAFKKSDSLEGYKELSLKVVEYARGVPLVLEILGSFLFDKNVAEWISELKKLEKFPPFDVHGRLRISFDSLDSEQKSLFLDIACFFIGVRIDIATQVLEGFDLYPEADINVLARRCLVKVMRNKLRMKDVVRDMGREIVRQECIEDPGKRSRVWDHEDAHNILTNNTGTEAIRGLVLSLPRSNKVIIDAKAFARMNQMKLLRLNNVRVSGSYESFSKRLVWISWHGFPSKCIPSDFHMENLVALDLQHSHFKKVWKGNKVLPKLKFLDLSHCDQLVKTPKFLGLTNLETLWLRGCTRLEKVDESICCLKRLRLLNLELCQSLRKLPESIYELRSLQGLFVDSCYKLELEASRHGALTTVISKIPSNFKTILSTATGVI